jgi:hypothetical protein
MIATDAIHDACESHPSPNVHQGTLKRFLQFESTISIRNFGPSGYMDQLTLDLRYWEIGRTALIAEGPRRIKLFFVEGRAGEGPTITCSLLSHINSLSCEWLAPLGR